MAQLRVNQARVVEVREAKDKASKYVTFLDKEAQGQIKITFPVAFPFVVDDLLHIDGEVVGQVGQWGLSLKMALETVHLFESSMLVTDLARSMSAPVKK